MRYNGICLLMGNHPSCHDRDFQKSVQLNHFYCSMLFGCNKSIFLISKTQTCISKFILYSRNKDLERFACESADNYNQPHFESTISMHCGSVMMQTIQKLRKLFAY